MLIRIYDSTRIIEKIRIWRKDIVQGIVTDNTELKKLILDNPSLPLLILVSEDANSGEWSTELASCRCEKGIVLEAAENCWLPRYDRVYTDETDLEEDIQEALEDIQEGLTDEEFDRLVAIKMKTLEPYWKECIIVIVESF
ncbi:MAG: hypothetical protein K2I96_03580 [Lachnospiraceae bacterium]|nr:hypothetical protein [Lachnospiraceae bacterium]